MPLTPLQVRGLIASLKGEYDRDDRAPPDERRRHAFIQGWSDATLRSEQYSAETLKVLTWQNLGYRAGRTFELSEAEAQYEPDLSEKAQCAQSSLYRLRNIRVDEHVLRIGEIC